LALRGVVEEKSDKPGTSGEPFRRKPETNAGASKDSQLLATIWREHSMNKFHGKIVAGLGQMIAFFA